VGVPRSISHNVILTPERLREEVKYFEDRPTFVFDVETMGAHRGDPVVNRVSRLSMATQGRSIVVPMGHPNGDVLLERERKRKDPVTKKFVTTPARWSEPPEQMRPGQIFDILEPLYFNPDIAKGAQNAPFDFVSVAKYFGGRVPVGPYHDTAVVSWILNENSLNGLKEVTKQRYKRKYDTENVGRKVEAFPFSKVAGYSYLDAKYTWLHLVDGLRRIEEEGLQDVYDLEMDVLRVLLSIGAQGTPVDIDRMKELAVELAERRDESKTAVFRAAGKTFNVNSNPQKQTLFYGSKKDGNLGLKPWKLTKGGLQKKDEGKELTIHDYSTDKESLERYEDNPVVKPFLEYQEVDRVLGTYILGYLGVEGDPKKETQIFEGKVYPDFVQYGTVTGRFSCRTPNLQNIPRPDTDLGKAVRGLFVAGPGHKLVVADYGQIELVVLAHYVGMGALYEGFFQGIDPHTMTAATVFQQDPEDLQRRVDAGDPEAKHMRQQAKAINFAVVYGAGPVKVASMAKVKERRAREILDIHQTAFPEIYDFKDQSLRVARSRKPPSLTTLMGRKRRIPTLMSREPKIRSRAERQMINSLIQGSAADLIKLAMVRLHTGLVDSGLGDIILTVHDEVVVRCPEENSDKVSEIVREAMTGSGIQDWVKVPLNIDLKVVDRWADAK
jgi:DNA polymerase I-like protein with 3'-5' exonuclease and polymerase domains